MFPHLFTIGGYSQSTYGLLVAVAFVVAITLTGRFAKAGGTFPGSGDEPGDVLRAGGHCRREVPDVHAHLRAWARSSRWRRCARAAISSAA